MRVSVHDRPVSAWLGTRVYVDGVEVTNRCYAADDGEGWADCYVLSADGKKVMVDIALLGRCVETERLWGKVELRRDTPGQAG